MERLAAMFQTLQGAPMAAERRDPEAHRSNVLMEFMKSKPPMFEGSSEDVTAEKWLREVKEKFDTLGVPQEYRVGFATYLFEGSVEEWWDLHMDDYDVSNLTWDKFETLFREKYVPGTQIGELVQGGMTVAEYHARFVELSACDPTIVADPILRCMKFKEGLRPKIRSKLAPLPMTDFSVLVAAALLTEADLVQNIGNKGSKDPNKKMGKKEKVHGHNKMYSSGRYEPYPCCHCKRTGHFRRNCPHRPLSSMENWREKQRNMLGCEQTKSSQTSETKEIGQCHNCRQTGHKRRNCPYRQQKSPLASGGQKRSESGPSAHNSQTQRAPKNNSSTSFTSTSQPPGLLTQYNLHILPLVSALQSQNSQGSETEEGSRFCYRCLQQGHIRRNCPNRQQKSPLASGVQQKSEFGPTSSVHNSQTLSSSSTTTSQPSGPLPQYYPHMLLHAAGPQQSENAPLTPQASGSQFSSASPGFDNSQTPLAPHKNWSVGKKDPLRGQNSQGTGTSGSHRSSGSGQLQPNTCHVCHQIGHLKRNCPYKGQQQSPLVLGGQQWSQFDLAS